MLIYIAAIINALIAYLLTDSVLIAIIVLIFWLWAVSDY